jgi:hypothetical protein
VSLSQNNAVNSFLVAGHAYGAHAGKNIGLHPPLLEKLRQIETTEFFALFLTGDIVNNSTDASWLQVEKELEQIGVPSYYVMGNHDDNVIGHTVFNNKHGGTYYSFNHENDCFIVLDSPKSDRSISSDQLIFLKEVLQNTDSKRVFVFFHEVIWNSDLKYKSVMSNSRSRYGQIVNYSNFWTDVFPLLTAFGGKHFYLFAGDVGGNTDAISAFYDIRGNATLLASGMGEVADENILKVDLSADTVKFTFLPLNNKLIMHEATYYAVPEAPATILGPTEIGQEMVSAEYWVEPVFNASSYIWSLPAGVTGESDSSVIDLAFNDQFIADTLNVYAVNEGFGKSNPTKLLINKLSMASPLMTKVQPSFNVEMLNINNEQYLHIQSRLEQTIYIELFNCIGQIIKKQHINIGIEENNVSLRNLIPQKSPVLLRATNGKERKVMKILF